MLSQALSFRSRKDADRPANQEAFTLRSGPGAPIFEPGPHTRIRRNPVRAIAAFTWPEGPREVYGQVVNISLSGCLLRTETTIEEGAELTMSITVLGGGGSQTIDVRGTVRRQTDVHGRRAYGVEFMTFTAQDRRATQALYAETAR